MHIECATVNRREKITVPTFYDVVARHVVCVVKSFTDFFLQSITEDLLLYIISAARDWLYRKTKLNSVASTHYTDDCDEYDDDLERT